MAPDKLNIIFYLFIVIFSITAIITFLGITNIVKTIREKYLNAMFGALILEVVAAVVLSYKQMDFGCQTDEILHKLTRGVEGVPENATNEERILVLESLVTYSSSNPDDVESLKRTADSLKVALKNCKETENSASLKMSKIDNVFYSNVIKLRVLAEKFKGRTINLVWDRSHKKEVYQVLGQIFVDLGYVGPDDELTDEYIIQKYIRFAEVSQWNYLLKKNDSGKYNQVLVDEYATTLFLREYLNQKYPLKKEE